MAHGADSVGGAAGDVHPQCARVALHLDDKLHPRKKQCADQAPRGKENQRLQSSQVDARALHIDDHFRRCRSEPPKQPGEGLAWGVTEGTMLNFGILADINERANKGRRSVEMQHTPRTRAEEGSVATEYGDITKVLGRALRGSVQVPKEASLGGTESVDIDAHRGRGRGPAVVRDAPAAVPDGEKEESILEGKLSEGEGCLPLASESYDGPVAASPRGTLRRRLFFDQSTRADQYASLLGRPGTMLSPRKTEESDLSAQALEMSEERKRRVARERGWRLTGSWWRTTSFEFSILGGQKTSVADRAASHTETLTATKASRPPVTGIGRAPTTGAGGLSLLGLGLATPRLLLDKPLKKPDDEALPEKTSACTTALPSPRGSDREDGGANTSRSFEGEDRSSEGRCSEGHSSEKADEDDDDDDRVSLCFSETSCGSAGGVPVEVHEQQQQHQQSKKRSSVKTDEQLHSKDSAKNDRVDESQTSGGKTKGCSKTSAANNQQHLDSARLSERLYREWELRERRLRASVEERQKELASREVVSKRGRLLERSSTIEPTSCNRPKPLAASRRLHQEATARESRMTRRRRHFLQQERKSIRAEAKACLQNPLSHAATPNSNYR